MILMLTVALAVALTRGRSLASRSVTGGPADGAADAETANRMSGPTCRASYPIRRIMVSGLFTIVPDWAASLGKDARCQPGDALLEAAPYPRQRWQRRCFFTSAVVAELVDAQR